MHARAAASATGTTVKALRYYEGLGLLAPVRLRNGYREYAETDLRVIREIRTLVEVGLRPAETRPFLECLALGHSFGDDCAESLAAYQSKIEQLEGLTARLTAARDDLVRRLQAAARRGLVNGDLTAHALPKPVPLPANLPPPEDDGAARHLIGFALPSATLPSTTGETIDISTVARGSWLLFVYPMTGDPAADLPRGWNEIPGARGCSTEVCGFRDQLASLMGRGIEAIVGLSSDPTDYQRHIVKRLYLPYPLLSDPAFHVARAIKLPTFRAAGRRLYRRLTMVIDGTVIRHVFYPIFPPDRHAEEVVAWLDRSGLHA